jgi:hypothetical protein
MLSNGMPQVNTLRRRAYQDDMTTEPVILYRHPGILRRIIRGILATDGLHNWMPMSGMAASVTFWLNTTMGILW